MSKRKETLDIILDPKEFAFYTGMTFRGLTITETSEGYNVVLRGFSRSGQALYAMTQARSARAGLAGLMNLLSSKGGESSWRHDRYYRNGTGG